MMRTEKRTGTFTEAHTATFAIGSGGKPGRDTRVKIEAKPEDAIRAVLKTPRSKPLKPSRRAGK